MTRQALVVLVVVLAFGILVPWYKGFAFLDPRIILAYGCMALLFVAPSSAESAAAHPADRPPSELLSKLAMVVFYGWGMTVLILCTALVTLNLMYWRGSILAPPFRLIAAVLLFSLTASSAIAGLCGVLARRLTATGIKSLLRFAFLVLLLALVMSSRLPDRWQLLLTEYQTRGAITRLAWEGSLACAALSMVFLAILRAARSNRLHSATMTENPLEEEDEQRRQY